MRFRVCESETSPSRPTTTTSHRMTATTSSSGLRLSVILLAILSNLLLPVSGPIGVGAVALNLKRAVWNPHIVIPNVETVWRVGEKVNVTWWVLRAMDYGMK